MTDEYAAGFFDGEGCVEIVRYKQSNGRFYCQIRIQITNTDPLVLEHFAKHWGGHLYSYSNKIGKPGYRWTVNGGMGEPFLSAILPYVIVKKAQVVLALEYLEWRRSPERKFRSTNGLGERTPEALIKEAGYRDRIMAMKREVVMPSGVYC